MVFTKYTLEITIHTTGKTEEAIKMAAGFKPCNYRGVATQANSNSHSESNAHGEKQQEASLTWNACKIDLTSSGNPGIPKSLWASAGIDSGQLHSCEVGLKQIVVFLKTSLQPLVFQMTKSNVISLLVSHAGASHEQRSRLGASLKLMGNLDVIAVSRAEHNNSKAGVPKAPSTEI